MILAAYTHMAENVRGGKVLGGNLKLYFPEDAAQWETYLPAAAIWEAGHNFLLAWADFAARCWEFVIAMGNQSKGK